MQSSDIFTTDIYVRHVVGNKELFRVITRLGYLITVVVGRLPASEGPGFSLRIERGGSGHRTFCTYGFRFQHGVVSYRTLESRDADRGVMGSAIAYDVTDWKSVLVQTQQPASPTAGNSPASTPNNATATPAVSFKTMPDRVVIFVGGVGFVTTGVSGGAGVVTRPLLGPPSRGTNYLAKELRTIVAAPPATTKEIIWNGDATDDSALRDAETQLEAQILQSKGKRVDLITHSMGTVIAYHALRNLAIKKLTRHDPAKPGNPIIANFVTLNSPIAQACWLREYAAQYIPGRTEVLSAAALNVRGGWTNIYHADDCIGGAIGAVGVSDVVLGQKSGGNPTCPGLNAALIQCVMTTHPYPYAATEGKAAILRALEDGHARLDAMGKGPSGAMPSAGGQWQVLKLGQSGNGIMFKRVGNDAIAFFDNMPIAKCVTASKMERQYLEGMLAVSGVKVSPPSPTGQYIAVFCASESDSAASVQLVDLKTKSFFSPGPRDLFAVLDPWISFSPDDRYAVLNQSGDEGNYAPLVLDLSTRRAAKLSAPLFPHDENAQVVWLNGKTVKYLASSICDDHSDPCKSLGVYEFEVDVSSMKVKRKRIADWRPQ